MTAVVDAPLTRILVEPATSNSRQDVVRVERSLLVFLGVAG